MTELIIVIYIANVFLNRWLNIIAVKKNSRDYMMIPVFWLIPILPTIVMVCTLIGEIKFFTKLINWYTTNKFEE